MYRLGGRPDLALNGPAMDPSASKRHFRWPRVALARSRVFEVTHRSQGQQAVRHRLVRLAPKPARPHESAVFPTMSGEHIGPCLR